MLKNISLRLKLTMAFLLLTAVLVGVSCYQVISTQHVKDLFSNLVDQDFARLSALNGIELSSANLRDKRVEYQQDVTNKAVDKALTQKELVTAQIEDLQTKTQLYISLTKIDNPNVKQETVDAIGASSKAVISSTLTVVNGSNTTDVQNALRSSQTKLDVAISEASNADHLGIEVEHRDIIQSTTFVLWTIVGLAMGASLIALLVGTSVAGWVANSLARLRNGAERIANGDFSQTISHTSNDEIGQLAETFNHMSERLKESYRRLGLSRQRDEAMLQGMGEGLIAVDSTGRIVVANPVAAQMLGSEAAKVGTLINESYKLYDPNDKAQKPLPPDQRPSFIALKTGQQVRGVYGYLTGEGQKRQLAISASPVKLDDKVAGAVTIIRDVTKEKEVDRMKTEFISLASHQLRTPLSAIKWFSEMLVSGDAGKLKPDQMDFAKNIADSTERMIALVNALLNISRIESGRIMIDPRPTDLSELVGGIINDLKGKTEEKQQTLIISVHEGLPKVTIDPRLIGQVYLNLLTNAIKYTPKGGEITVFISRKDEEIISQVTDNGYGIPKEQQARVFEKFFRAANAVKVETDGTGLGLYLIKAVVESSGGKIWFKSEENKGTSFWFSIPVSGMKRKEGEVTLDA